MNLLFRTFSTLLDPHRHPLPARLSLSQFTLETKEKTRLAGKVLAENALHPGPSAGARETDRKGTWVSPPRLPQPSSRKRGGEKEVSANSLQESLPPRRTFQSVSEALTL